MTTRPPVLPDPATRWNPTPTCVPRAGASCERGSLALASWRNPRARRRSSSPGTPSTPCPRARSRRSSAEGRAAARQARHRPHRARHPPRAHRRPSQTAGVSGPRSHRRADHRRLHRAGGGPQRALGDPAAALGRGDRPQRRDLPAPGVHWCSTPSAPRSAATASGSTCRWRTSSASPAPPPWRSCSSATTSPSATRPASRSRSSSCSTRCSRATTRWRSRPTSSSAGPTRRSTSCSRATSSRPTA